MDTQWPLYQVFLQEQEGDLFKDVGSVHAPDPELGLLNARDVFARRPPVNRVWVVPASAITALYLHSPVDADSPEMVQGDEISYQVFFKNQPAKPVTQLGEVFAPSGQEAISRAQQLFSRPDMTVFAWWAFPTRCVHASPQADSAAWFAPASNKPFRLSNHFHTVTAIRRAKASTGRAVKGPMEA